VEYQTDTLDAKAEEWGGQCRSCRREEVRRGGPY
jgi:hypothetical protein